MKITKSELVKANKSLSKFNLEMECINSTTGKYKVFCKNISYTEFERENMEIANSQLITAKNWSDIKYNYFFAQ